MHGVPSNAAKGSYYKLRTKKWLIARGFQVASLEVVRWIYGRWPNGRRGRLMPVKFDQFGSDLLAVNADRIVFVQVKGGEAARTGFFPESRRTFETFTFPPGSRQVVIAWAPRASKPRVIDMTRKLAGGARPSTAGGSALYGEEESGEGKQAQRGEAEAGTAEAGAAARRHAEGYRSRPNLFVDP